MADFPGVARSQAVAFAAGGKGYVGTGYDGLNRLRDFWQYDPAADRWTRKADFGGSARYGAAAFALNDKGYVATGYDGNYKKDLWQYDPQTDAWAAKPSFGGDKRLGGVAFMVGNRAYVLGGNDNGAYPDDLWSYDPGTEQWTEHRALEDNDDEDYDYSALPRTYGAAFTIGQRAFVTTSSRDGQRTDCWEYSAAADTWTKKTAFGGSARIGAVGFELAGRGFVALGVNGSARLDDCWELAPDEDDD